jgi:hypothetical protein
MEVLKNPIGIIQCRHRYCFKCIKKWCKIPKEVCPMCKHTISELMEVNEIRAPAKRRKLNNPEGSALPVISN